LSATSPVISISIVSHLQAALIKDLLADIASHCHRYPLEVILTLNLPEELAFNPERFSFPVIVHRNTVPQGFAANQNQAFAQSSGQFFCVLNPDIRIQQDVFPALLTCLQTSNVGVAAPLVMDDQGMLEDSARRFPTPLTILCKAFGGCKGSDYDVQSGTTHPDWVGGMFMLLRREVFAEAGGFDERYFMYYEDVNLCARLRLRGYEVNLCPDVSVVHLAQRHSHRSLRYMRWHLASMARFFCSASFLKICWQRMWQR
jgi:GT2 family glycosyltransferase